MTIRELEDLLDPPKNPPEIKENWHISIPEMLLDSRYYRPTEIVRHLVSTIHSYTPRQFQERLNQLIEQGSIVEWRIMDHRLEIKYNYLTMDYFYL